MKIIGIEGLTTEAINLELQQGAKFVMFQYCFSIIVMTFRRSSKNIYFIRAGESAAGKAVPYSLISFLFGWWGIPWGPIWTMQSLILNFKGGQDVTQEISEALNKQ